MQGRYTVSLAAEDLEPERVGGKASCLNRLIRAGFCVPPGFCLTTEAFERAADRCIARVDTLAELRTELRQVDVSERLVDEVRQRLEAIGAERWAVRSSAVGEDAESASFAGQQRTELDVSGPRAVVDAIRRIWADLYNLESLLYRARLRVDAVPRPMAVVVQAMVEPEVGGVMFTENPVQSGASEDEASRRDIVIAAASGSGMAVVEGRGGEHVVVDRESGEVRRPSGDGAAEPLLEPSRLRDLAELGRSIERAFGRPQDIEWAVGRRAGGGVDGEPMLYVLQSRPITGRNGGLVDGEVWSNVNVGEALPGVATPLTWSIIGKFSRRGFERAFATLGLEVPDDYELVGSFRGRVYLNLTQFVSVASGIPILDPETLFQVGGGGGVELVREVAESGSPLEFLRHLPATAARVLFSQAAMPLAAPLWSRYFDWRLAAFFDRNLAAVSREALGDELEAIDRLFDRTGLVMLTCSSNFLMSYLVMKRVLEWFGSNEVRERERTLFEALEVQSAEPVLELLELVRLARRYEAVDTAIRGEVPSEVGEVLQRRASQGEPGTEEFLDRLEAFLAEHGHRAPREAELSTPRWRERPEFVFEMIGNYLEAAELPGAERYRDRWAEKRSEVDALVDRGFSAFLSPGFRLLLGWARATARIREFMRSHVVEALDMYRHLARECGRRLVRAGVAKEVDDVFFLRHDELRRWLTGDGQGGGPSEPELARRAMVRRELVDALRELPDPPDTFVVRDGDLVDAREVRPTSGISPRDEQIRAVLEGLAGSPGRVEGRARVVEDPSAGTSLEPGEVLVAPYTDVGWSPLFMTASAIVMGLGGPLSHACIVAREFGIPTVVNARDAADVIRTGDRVTVDGDEGIVYVHAREGDAPDQ